MKKTFLLFIISGLFLTCLQSQTNQYLHFDRVDDYVRLDNGSQYIANTSAMTMTGWFYTDQLAYGQGMIGLRGTSNGFYLIQLSDGTLECRLQTGTGLHQYVGPNFTILPGVWQHVAWVYDGSSVTLYIDGVVKGSSPASGQITATDIPFTIGRSILTNLDFYFGGGADEVTLWDKALSQAEIQNMMTNELTGTEPNLQLYYKFNQGQPEGDNTSISKLISEVGGGTRDANLVGFTLNGTTSNFVGTLQAGFQAISFSEIPNKLTTDAAFELDATASSGLDVVFTIDSGPATITGDSVFLDGTPGEVVVTASQPGDGTWGPAASVSKSFTVVDPQLTTPQVELRNPLSGNVYVPTLSEIQLAAIVETEFSEILSVDKVEFEVDGQIIPARDWGNGHYTAWWKPAEYKGYILKVRAFNDFGAATTEVYAIAIHDNPQDVTKTAFSGVVINSTVFSQEIEAELPSFLGAYDKITADLQVTCPPGQACGPWDRVAKVEVKNHEGVWMEMIRYITPYGVPCSHELDVTDFVSTLQGKVRFRMSCETFDQGFQYQLNFDYKAGTPDYLYSSITPLWHQTFDFGNMADLTPVPSKMVEFPENAEKSTMKLIASGHGWGVNNTNNAAEFFNTTHHVWVNDVDTYAQHNWLVCNPNPDGCQPQNGTWYHNRAGFCPGAISPWFDYDMSSYIADKEAKLDYIFDQSYVDLCHANNPNCVTGVTCDNCNDGFNPHLIVASSMIHFSNTVLDSIGSTTDIDDLVDDPGDHFTLYPNPTSGRVEIQSREFLNEANISVINTLGNVVGRYEKARFRDNRHSLNLDHLASGMYMIIIESRVGRVTKPLHLSH